MSFDNQHIVKRQHVATAPTPTLRPVRSPWQAIKGLFARSNVDRGLTKRVKQPQHQRDGHTRKSVLPGIDPTTLARVIREADSGYYDNYLVAAAELEERDAQYGPQLAVRRTAVAALELTVHRPKGATSRAVKAAQELLDSKTLKPFIADALDALGKGFAISEIVWTKKHGKWVPICVSHDQREFQWSERLEEWRFRDYSGDGAELARNKWVVHQPKLRAGIPIRRGLARPAMFLHMAKSMSLAGWVTLMQIYGVPLAIATLPAETNDLRAANDATVIRAALAGLGQGSNAIVPTGSQIEVINAASQGSPHMMFSVLLDYVDKQMSKLVLGQTMTTDNGSSHAQATVHNDVRKDIREGDAEDLSWTINEYIVKPYIDFNVGEQKVYPEVYFAQPDARNIKDLADALAPLLGAGLRAKAEEVRAWFGLSTPEDGDEVIGGAPVSKGEQSEPSVDRMSSRRRYKLRASSSRRGARRGYALGARSAGVSVRPPVSRRGATPRQDQGPERA